MQSDVFRITFVCTGNRCRSPFAARVLETMTVGLPVTISSVGTLDAPGQPVPPELVMIGASSGIELGDHKATPLQRGSLEDADLVIGFQFDHSAAAVVQGGAARSKTFTLPELTDLLRSISGNTDDGVEGMRDVIRRADDLRQRSGVIEPLPEVIDPFGGPKRGYERMAQEVVEHCRHLVERLWSEIEAG